MVTNAFCILNDDVDFVCNGLFCDEILSMWKLSLFHVHQFIFSVSART